LATTKSAALAKLAELISRIPAVRAAGQESVEYFRWLKDTESALVNFFTVSEGKRHLSEFKDLHSQLAPSELQALDLGLSWKTFSKALDLSEAYLRSVEEEVKEFYDDDPSPRPATTPKEGNPESESKAKEVFIIHGRDDGLKETVARFLARLGLSPIILHERPNAGRTLIEKFEANAVAGFAVALFTPDDVGALQSERDSVQERPRQNVVFEFGYFIGRLGRKGACALIKGDIELPSDYAGVVYIRLDEAGHWKFELIRELKAAGYDVDANRAL
jgi:predicted nucleotide-binding protein